MIFLPMPFFIESESVRKKRELRSQENKYSRLYIKKIDEAIKNYTAHQAAKIVAKNFSGQLLKWSNEAILEAEKLFNKIQKIREEIKNL